jgi:hypothetical protein
MCVFEHKPAAPAACPFSLIPKANPTVFRAVVGVLESFPSRGPRHGSEAADLKRYRASGVSRAVFRESGRISSVVDPVHLGVDFAFELSVRMQALNMSLARRKDGSGILG